MQRSQFLLHKRHLSEFPFKVDLLSNSMQLTLISYEYTYVYSCTRYRYGRFMQLGPARFQEAGFRGMGGGGAAVGTLALL